MRVDTRPRKRNAPRPRWKVALGYLQWLRGRCCLIGHDCEGKIQACHVDYAGDKGMGTKVSDRFAVPMCAHHHREQTDGGMQTFEAKHRVNLLKAAEAYWNAWPGRHEWEQSQ